MYGTRHCCFQLLNTTKGAGNRIYLLFPMGGRKEDTAKMKEKRRPLSIIEEFENKDDILSAPDTRKFSVPKIVITSENGELTSDLAQLKKTATRLNLSTRRESYIAWRAEHIDKQHNVPKPVLKVDHDERLTVERKKKIDDALEWLRNELQEMRSQDQQIARRLLSLRHDIHQLKLQRSCAEHQELLDDAQSELEELEELPDVLDLPAGCLNNNPYKHLGVTRMNLSTRRFSTC
ncbi:protein FAM167A-like isoform X1 [Haliotis rufescens]|uniref:protein FAM167A-like isoform X1 n=2 Tax=Haliotis rufescens TaxID=6454 RepID=UPI001EAFBFB0|nr:protein FAM167A-like isoform X1 [Haliotis rufescens]